MRLSTIRIVPPFWQRLRPDLHSKAHAKFPASASVAIFAVLVPRRPAINAVRTALTAADNLSGDGNRTGWSIMREMPSATRTLVPTTMP